MTQRNQNEFDFALAGIMGQVVFEFGNKKFFDWFERRDSFQHSHHNQKFLVVTKIVRVKILAAKRFPVEMIS